MNTPVNNSVNDPIYLELAGKVQELEQALLAEHPQMPTLLRQIHAGLLQNPAAIHSLSDDQISLIIRGLTSYTNTEIVASTKPKASAAKKALSKVTADDL